MCPADELAGLPAARGVNGELRLLSLPPDLLGDACDPERERVGDEGALDGISNLMRSKLVKQTEVNGDGSRQRHTGASATLRKLRQRRPTLMAPQRKTLESDSEVLVCTKKRKNNSP